jgi:hypothetical protein
MMRPGMMSQLRRARLGLAAIAWFLVVTSPVAARSDGPGAPGLKRIGAIRPRAASEITSSSWSIGGETLDRDFADYHKYKAHLGPLGAKAIRLQAGWAKCEKARGVYDFAWLDAIVDDARSRGVQPWLETSYGNTLYPGGGGTGLGGGIPRSPEALAAWSAWVKALVLHFRDRVHEWEIWNEPDLNDANTPTAFADFLVRTAKVIRQEQPDAVILAMGLAHRVEFAVAVLNDLKQRGELGLVDAVTVHSYPNNPDDLRVPDQVRAWVEQNEPRIQVRQGETGAPSTAATFGALAGRDWTENTQAKWDLRRMLAHHGKGYPFNLFTLMELHYPGRMNTKGLLQANPDGTVARPKPAYRAAQNVFAIFDDTLVRTPVVRHEASGAPKIAVQGYRHETTGAAVVAVWLSAAPPVESNATTSIDLAFPDLKFKEPVYVDLLTGDVFALEHEGATFKNVPIYDAPILIAERSALPLTTAPSPR